MALTSATSESANSRRLNRRCDRCVDQKATLTGGLFFSAKSLGCIQHHQVLMLRKWCPGRKEVHSAASVQVGRNERRLIADEDPSISWHGRQGIEEFSISLGRASQHQASHFVVVIKFHHFQQLSVNAYSVPGTCGTSSPSRSQILD